MRQYYIQSFSGMSAVRALKLSFKRLFGVFVM